MEYKIESICEISIVQKMLLIKLLFNDKKMKEMGSVHEKVMEVMSI